VTLTIGLTRSLPQAPFSTAQGPTGRSHAGPTCAFSNPALPRTTLLAINLGWNRKRKSQARADRSVSPLNELLPASGVSRNERLVRPFSTELTSRSMYCGIWSRQLGETRMIHEDAFPTASVVTTRYEQSALHGQRELVRGALAVRNFKKSPAARKARSVTAVFTIAKTSKS
jgi:hypothetical protein